MYTISSINNNYKEIGSVAVIGNYLPRQCGIATFTTDLVEALSKELPDKLPNGYNVLDNYGESVGLMHHDLLDIAFCLKVAEEIGQK